jgi:ABC-type branched-subunit amino acid transport system substrate-binding protein
MSPDTARRVGSTRWLIGFAFVLGACSPTLTAPPEPPLSVRRGDQFFRYEEYDAAIGAYRTYLDHTETGLYTPRVFYKTALAQYRLKEYHDTLLTLDELALRYPKGQWVQVDALRGDAERALGHPMTALQAYESAWEIAGKRDRAKLRPRIIAVSRGLNDVDLARARRLANSEDVATLLDQQIASRQPAGIGEAIPETGEGAPEALAAAPSAPRAAADIDAPLEPADEELLIPEPAPPARVAKKTTEGTKPLVATKNESALEPVPPMPAAPVQAVPAPPPQTTQRDAWQPPPPTRLLPPEPAPELVAAAREPAAAEPHLLLSEEAAAAEPKLAPAAERPMQGPAQVGCLLPLTGRDREFGERSLRALRLVFEQDSDRLVVKDVGSNPATAVKALDELSRDPRVLAVIGPLRSDDAEAAARRAEQIQMPLLLLSQRDGLGGRFVLQVGMTRSRLVGGLLDYAMGRARLRRFGVIYPADAYGRQQLSAFRTELKRRGGTLVGADAYRPDTKALAVGTVKRWRDDQNMQALFIPDSAMIAAQFAKVLQEEMPDVTLLGVHGWENLAQYGDGTAVSGVLFSDAFYAESVRPATRNFVLRFQQAYGQPPGVPEAQAYDAGLLVKHALDAGANTRADLLRQLHGLGTVAGATGNLRITTTGLQRSLFLIQVYDGKLEEVSRGTG